MKRQAESVKSLNKEVLSSLHLNNFNCSVYTVTTISLMYIIILYHTHTQMLIDQIGRETATRLARRQTEIQARDNDDLNQESGHWDREKQTGERDNGGVKFDKI